MNLSDEIASLQSNAEQQLHALSSGKKTENALVLPFLKALGYDPFDVREVEPDFELGREDRGEDRGVRSVDYAIKEDGSPNILLQCAEAKTNLDVFEDHFLLDVLDEVEADVVAFTNGLSYQFYADLPADINVENRPFLEFNLLDFGPDQVGALKRLSKPAFDSEEIRSVAHELQSSRLLREYLAQQMESPDDPFVQFLAARIYEGKVSNDLLEQFRPVVKKVLGTFAEGEGTAPASASSEDEGSAAPTSEEDIELTSSDEGPVGDPPVGNQDETEEGEGGPFDKDLAKRVIEEF